MLTPVVNLRPRSRQLQLIAQELAMDICEYRFMPIVTQHLPGVANKVADELSRRHQPDAVAKHMSFLDQAEEVQVPMRDAKYYATLDCAPEQYG